MAKLNNSNTKLPAKRKRGRPSKNSSSIQVGSEATAALNSRASGAAKNPSASVTQTVVQKKRGRPLKARKTTSSRPSIAGSPRPILDNPQLSIGLPADTPAVGTAIAADEAKKVLVALKQAVGCPDILDEEFLDLLKRTNPNLLGDILSIKHQLQTTTHNRSDSANSRPGSVKPAAETSSAAALVTTAPDTPLRQSTTDTGTGSARANRKAQPETEYTTAKEDKPDGEIAYSTTVCLMGC